MNGLGVGEAGAQGLTPRVPGSLTQALEPVVLVPAVR